jgi:hypothetical protein
VARYIVVYLLLLLFYGMLLLQLAGQRWDLAAAAKAGANTAPTP